MIYFSAILILSLLVTVVSENYIYIYIYIYIIFLAHNTSLIPPLYIDVPVPSMQSEWSCICVRSIDFVLFYDFLVTFETIPAM